MESGRRAQVAGQLSEGLGLGSWVFELSTLNLVLGIFCLATLQIIIQDKFKVLVQC